MAAGQALCGCEITVSQIPEERYRAVLGSNERGTSLLLPSSHTVIAVDHVGPKGKKLWEGATKKMV
jgi:hypothetical protein